MERWSRSWLAMLLVAALAAGCYLNVLDGPFLYDDLKDVANNPILVERGRLAEVFTTSFLHQGLERGLYRPIAGLSYWVDQRLFGPEPFWFHLENLLWHAAASLVLLALLRRLWPGEPVAALLGAFLFAAHPVHTEAVSWISGRSEVLATFWGLVAFLAHRLADREGSAGAALFRAAALASWLVAVGAKEMAATVPLLLLLTDALLGSPRDWARPARLAARYGPYAAGAAAYLALRWKVLGGLGPVGAHQYFHGAPLSVRGPTMLKVAAAYVGRLLLPVNLNAAWTVTHAKGMADGPLPLLAAALLAGLLLLGWALREKAPPVAWGIFWTALALLPVSNLLPVGELGAERFLYWPSVGACGALGWAVAPRGEGARPRALSAALAGAVLVLFAANTVDRNRDWSNPLALWSKTVSQSPDSVNARMNLGKALFQAGRVEEAGEQFEAALKLSPNYVEGLNNLGAVYARLGRLDEARRAFRRVTLIEPGHGDGWFNLGYLLYKQGDLPGAEKAMERARAADPQNPKTAYLSGVVAFRLGKLDEAEALWRETLRLDPSFTRASRSLSALRRARR